MARFLIPIFTLIVLFSFAPNRANAELTFWPSGPYYLNGANDVEHTTDVDIAIDCSIGDTLLFFPPDGSFNYNIVDCGFPYYNPLWDTSDHGAEFGGYGVWSVVECDSTAPEADCSGFENTLEYLLNDDPGFVSVTYYEFLHLPESSTSSPSTSTTTINIESGLTTSDASFVIGIAVFISSFALWGMLFSPFKKKK